MRADARRNYEHIVEVARAAFTEHGVDVPLDDITKRAKVGAGTLYRHFPTREALIEAVFRSEMTAMSERAYELLETRPPFEALEEWLRLQLRFVEHKRGLGLALRAMDQGAETFAYCKKLMTEAVSAIVDRARQDGVIRADVRPGDILRLLHGIALASEADPSSAERLLAIMLAGIRA
ncbi:TetR/AcrR family transcriptional regulator [Fodinicola acaciae]|uniref:TetR/AcrR family transcriptional regulator n=1 Tax=Fodinicola acaciae TaxID=2681555 RepID=UPI0013D538B0|nr:TetR/AcrR family transcriptional regulator [Fodinicola acaciae]